MDETARKPMPTPLEAVSIKAQEPGGEPWPSKQQVAGSSPAGRARIFCQNRIGTVRHPRCR